VRVFENLVRNARDHAHLGSRRQSDYAAAAKGCDRAARMTARRTTRCGHATSPDTPSPDRTTRRWGPRFGEMKTAPVAADEEARSRSAPRVGIESTITIDHQSQSRLIARRGSSMGRAGRRPRVRAR
jgi:hypothetical protein